MSPPLRDWSVHAINLPEHANNPVHTDAGALAAGYPSALVAGTSVYAYLTHPPAVAWGDQWLAGGGGELKLKAAVFDNDLVECIVSTTDEGSLVTATVGGSARATFEVWQDQACPPMRSGDELQALSMLLDGDLASYGTRSGDTLDRYADGTAHPALWLVLANQVFMKHLVTGPWVHTRSKVWHRGMASIGDELEVRATVVDRFETRAGKRDLVDIDILANGTSVARVEHEAIVELS